MTGVLPTVAAGDADRQTAWSPRAALAQDGDTIGGIERANPEARGLFLAPMGRRIAIWIGLSVVATVLALAHYQSFQLGTQYDDSVYVVLARSLINSDVFGLINAPGQPAAERYPFGFPFILSLVMRIFPDSPDALKVPSLMASLVNVAILFWGWRWLGGGTSGWLGTAVSALYALSPLTVGYTSRVLSEPVFTTFCLLSILLAEQGARAREKVALWWPTAMSIALVFVVFTRTIGVVLLFAVVARLFLTRGWAFWRCGALIAAQMAFLVALIVAATPLQTKDLLPSQYLNDPNAGLLVAPLRAIGLSKQAGRIVTPSWGENFIAPEAKQSIDAAWIDRVLGVGIREHLGRDVRNATISIGGGQREQTVANSLGVPWFSLALGLLTSGIILLGWSWSILKERFPLFPLFGLLYVGSLFIWNWDDVRLLYPIMPELYFGLLVGIEAPPLAAGAVAGWGRVWAAVVRAGLIGLVLLLVGSSAYKSWHIEDTRDHVGDLAARTFWLKQHSSPSDVTMTEIPATDFLYSDRKTIWYPQGITSATQFGEYLKEHDVRYVLVAPEVSWQETYRPVYDETALRFLPILQTLRARRQVSLVYASPEELIQVFEVER